MQRQEEIRGGHTLLIGRGLEVRLPILLPEIIQRLAEDPTTSLQLLAVTPRLQGGTTMSVPPNMQLLAEKVLMVMEKLRLLSEKI